MEELSLGKYDHTSFLPLHDFNTLQNKMRGLHLPMFVIFFLSWNITTLSYIYFQMKTLSNARKDNFL